MILKALLPSALLLFFLPCLAPGSFAMDPSYWVTYQVDASVRTPPATTWTQWYTGPFGVNMGYGTGMIFNDPTITDPSRPNCFSFKFMPETSSGLVSIRQEISVTEFRGDSLCNPNDPNQVTTLGVIDMTVEQKQSNTFQFPYLNGRQIQVTLSQSWDIQ